ncbi:lymphocyte antigen 6E-like [Spea bombifrons]|uniref:lymphocyte antigen 6E-like n=1 Tax=Spea bombifrons TaxID=233779 RepID=UPI0023494900|nr:lymphocyte antigen 6E-like [Spea bombifrons]
MDATKVILLLAALCLGTAVTLQCYTCTDQSSNSNCMTATNCSESSTSCMTSVISGGFGGQSATTITKSCESACTATSFNVFVVSTSVSCCGTNLCNTSGAGSVRSGSSLLALGFLFALTASFSL